MDYDTLNGKKKKKTTHESMVIFFKNQVWNGRRKAFFTEE